MNELFDTNATDVKSILHDLRITGKTLRAARGKNDVLDFTIRIFRKLGFDRVRIWLIDEEKRIYRGAKASYMPDKKFQKAWAELDGKVLPGNYVSYLKRKKPYQNKKMALLKKFFGDHELPYTVGFPLLAGKELLGVVSVDNLFSGRKINLRESETKIMPFVNHIALVLNRVVADKKIKIANRELKNKIEEATTKLKIKNEVLEKLAHYDQLTELPNRRFLQKKLKEMLHENRSFVCTMLDIDFLKHVNDTHGHAAGDRLLAKLGDILQKEKDIDFAARFAGDEFVFLVKGKNKKKCTQVLEKVLRKIKKSTGTTVSAGCIALPHPEVKSLTDLIRLTDNALYHAKHSGRNRFVFFGEENEPIYSFAERKLNLQKIEEQGTFALDYIRQLATINKISEYLRSSSSEKIALCQISTSIQKTLNFIRVGIFLKMENGKLRLAAHSSKKDLRLVKIVKNPEKVQLLQKKLLETIQKRKVIDFNSSKHKLAFSFVENFGIEKTLFIPLIGRRHVIGVIVAQYDPNNFFRKSDLDFFLTLGAQIENGVVKARAIAEVENFNRKLKKEVSAATTQLRKYSSSLEEQIRDNQELREKEQRTHFELVSSLVTSLEEKDIYTRGHSVRVASYAVKLGRELGMSKNELTDLRYAGLLHDVGKVAVDQSILQKRTALTETEARELEKHPLVGEKIVSSVRFLKSAAVAIREHHERWNGGGYPDGLRGTKILREARILSIADAYDAMITRRSYGRKMSKLEAIRELEAGGGKQFDPQLTKIFVKMLRSGRVRKPKSKFSKF